MGSRNWMSILLDQNFGVITTQFPFKGIFIINVSIICPLLSIQFHIVSCPSQVCKFVSIISCIYKL